MKINLNKLEITCKKTYVIYNTNIIINIETFSLLSEIRQCSLLLLLFIIVLEISGNALTTRNKIYSVIYHIGEDKIAIVNG